MLEENKFFLLKELELIHGVSFVYLKDVDLYSSKDFVGYYYYFDKELTLHSLSGPVIITNVSGQPRYNVVYKGLIIDVSFELAKELAVTKPAKPLPTDLIVLANGDIAKEEDYSYDGLLGCKIVRPEEVVKRPVNFSIVK